MIWSVVTKDTHSHKAFIPAKHWPPPGRAGELITSPSQAAPRDLWKPKGKLTSTQLPRWYTVDLPTSHGFAPMQTFQKGKNQRLRSQSCFVAQGCVLHRMQYLPSLQRHHLPLPKSTAQPRRARSLWICIQVQIPTCSGNPSSKCKSFCKIKILWLWSVGTSL